MRAREFIAAVGGAPALPRADRAMAIGGLLVVAAIAALTFRDYGLGWDDYTHSQYGDLLVSFYGSGFTDRRALSICQPLNGTVVAATI